MTTTIIIPINPVPASRPRVFRTGGVGYSKNYAKWKREAVKATKELKQETPTYDKEVPLLVVLTHRCLMPKTSKLFAPRFDVDNADKAAMDLINDLGIWHDDAQVVTSVSNKRWITTSEEPSTEVIIHPLPVDRRIAPVRTKIFQIQTIVGKFVEQLFIDEPWSND